MPKKNPLTPYLIRLHKNGPLTYASTRIKVVSPKSGKTVQRHVHWGSFDEETRKFTPNAKFLMLPPEEMRKLIFPTDWDLSIIDHLLRQDNAWTRVAGHGALCVPHQDVDSEPSDDPSQALCGNTLQEASTCPRIVVLGTGGTISGECTDPTLGDSFYDIGKRSIADILASVPDLHRIARVYSEQIGNIPSDSMTLALWTKLARRINEIFASDMADGIVITHGTDTLEETAYFLNLTVHSDRPVVLVGAMRPANALSADGPLNLVNAIVTACSPESRGKGVLVVTNGKINGARDVCKSNTLAVETFNSHELGYLGYVVGDMAYYYKTSARRHTTASEFFLDDLRRPKKVTILYGHVEEEPALVQAAIQVSDGIVHAGPGNGSMSPAIQTLLEEAVRSKGLVVVRTSRTGNCLVTDTPAFRNSGFVCGDNLSPQKARILLLLALSKNGDLDDIRRIFSTY